MGEGFRRQLVKAFDHGNSKAYFERFASGVMLDRMRRVTMGVRLTASPLFDFQVRAGMEIRVNCKDDGSARVVWGVTDVGYIEPEALLPLQEFVAFTRGVFDAVIVSLSEFDETFSLDAVISEESRDGQSAA